MHTGAAHRQDMVNLLDVYIRCNETCHLKPSSLQLRRLHGFCRRPFSDFLINDFLKRFSKNRMVFIEYFSKNNLFVFKPVCFARRPDFRVKMQTVHSGTVYAALAPKNGKAGTEKVLVRVPGRFLFGVLMSKISPARSFVVLLFPATFQPLFNLCATKRCGPNCLKLHAICKLLQKVDQYTPPFVWFTQRPRKCRRFLAKIHDG